MKPESQDNDPTTVGLLLSGGLDSAILLQVLLDSGRRVQPFYVDSGLFWQADELRALKRYLSEAAVPRLASLVTLELPLVDVYEEHWSVTGKNVPPGSSPDRSVFLPGHNALLLIKPALWCQMHGIRELALATLKSSPFADATAQFFQAFETTLSISFSNDLRIVRPFAQLDKREVMEWGRDLPLERTFSCLDPVRGRHCGACNKCAERQAAFRMAGRNDLTVYSHRSPAEA